MMMYTIPEPSTRPAFPTTFRNIEATDSVLGGDETTQNPANAPITDLHQGLQWAKFGIEALEAGNFTLQAQQVIAGLQATVMASPSGSPVRMTNTSTLVLPAGLKLPNDNRTEVMAVAADTPVSIVAGNGLNAIDTGTVLPNSIYYLFIIKNPTTGNVGGLLSLSATSPLMPSGFTIKQRYPVDFCTNSSTATPRFIMKQLVSHQEALFNVPLVVKNGAITSNAASPDTLDVSAVVGNTAVAITFEFWDFPDNLFSGQLLFYPDLGITYPFNSGEVIRLDSIADTNTSPLIINSTKTYKMARQNGLATTIKISKVNYLPLI